jgi:hypothetical protein
MPDFRGWAQTSKIAVLQEQRNEKDAAGQEVFIHVLERK